MPAVGVDALVDWVDGELPLAGVVEQAEEQVAAEDEGLGAEHAFPEVVGATHLGHELDEEHGAAVRVDGLHEADELALEAYAFWRSGGGDYGALFGVVAGQGCVVVGARLPDDGCGFDEDEDVDPDRCVGCPAQLLQCSDLPKNGPGNGPDEAEDDEADGAFGDLGQALAVQDDDNTYVEHQLD